MKDCSKDGHIMIIYLVHCNTCNMYHAWSIKLPVDNNGSQSYSVRLIMTTLEVYSKHEYARACTRFLSKIKCGCFSWGKCRVKSKWDWFSLCQWWQAIRFYMARHVLAMFQEIMVERWTCYKVYLLRSIEGLIKLGRSFSHTVHEYNSVDLNYPRWWEFVISNSYY